MAAWTLHGSPRCDRARMPTSKYPGMCPSRGWSMLRLARHSLDTSLENRALCGFTPRDAKPLQVRNKSVFFGLAHQRLWRFGNLLVGVRHAETTQCLHASLYVGAFDRVVLQPGVSRHVGFPHDCTRITKVDAMPIVGITLTNARQVRPRALGAPQERVVVDRFASQRVRAVTLYFGAQHAN